MSPVFAYIGPEVTIPAFSVLAAVAGVLLMFGKMAVRWATYPFRLLFGRTTNETATGEPNNAPVQSAAMADSGTAPNS